LLFVFLNKPHHFIEFMIPKPSILGEGNGTQPKLSQLPITLDMDMGRFAAIGTEKDEAIGTNLKNCRHY